jgi:Rap1a immunity proteins
MKNIILVLTILVCFSARANAAVTANEYRENCHQYLDNKDSGKAGLCLGYAAGFMDGVSGAKFTSNDTVYTVSFREGVTAKQVLLAVVAYIDKRPEILHQPIWSVFIDALMESKLLVAKPDKDLHSRNVQ